MGLFDHLFKPRSDDSVERVVEAPLKASRLIEMREEGVEEPTPDPATAFLHPKGYASGAQGGSPGVQNQGFVPVLPAVKRATLAERKPAPPGVPPAATSYVVLVVGDVLPRIPAALLRPGPHDLKRELRFQIADLFSDLTRGRPVIALSCIAEQCPELFHRRISDDDDMVIRLPLQKLVEQVGRLPSGPPAALPPSVPPAVHPPSAGPVGQLPSEPPAPEPPLEEKILAPDAPMPILPPPVVAGPPPAPVPEMIAPIAPEFPPASDPEPPVAIAADIPEELPPPPIPAPAGDPAAERAPSEITIELSLAAIVARVPREMLAGDAPHIAESGRISLPFPMIERQLGTGSVAIPGDLFWSVIPPLLRHHFILREGVAVPLPLEEIFQNLPGVALEEGHRREAMGGLTPRPPAPETPIVLTPLPAAEPSPDLEIARPQPPAAPAPEPPVVVEPVASEIVEEPLPAPAAPEIPLAAPQAPVLTASVPSGSAPDSPATATPDQGHSVFVHLQPFRVFSPPSPAMDQEVEPRATNAEAVLIGHGPPAPTTAQPPSILSPAATAATAPAGRDSALRNEVAQGPAARRPPAPTTLAAASPDEETPRFHALATPALPPEPAPVEAFTPDQPPPLKIEVPAAAVAVLRATVSGPQEAPVFATATVSVPPPKIFRPVVLAPPISGCIATPPANLAPTLSGAAANTTGLISLAPATEAPGPEPQPPASTPATPPPPPPDPPREAAAVTEPVAPAATTAPAAESAVPSPLRDSAPTLKNFVRQVFHLPPVASAPKAPAATPPPAMPDGSPPAPALRSAPAAAPPSAPEPPPFHLQLPPLPHADAAPAIPEPAPPALPISRFDQHSLQSLFMTEEALDLPRVSRLAAALPGIQACVITAQGRTFAGGNLPNGFDLGALRGLAPQVGAAADRLPIGLLKNFTLYGEEYSVSFFERPAVCLCAIHRARSFVPGVREKLVAVVDELAREVG